MLDIKTDPQDNRELISLLHTILDVGNYGIIVINTKRLISFVNKPYAELFGLKVEDMIGKFVDDAYVNSEPSRLPIVLKTGKPEIGDIYFLNGRNVMANRYPIYQNGKVIGAVGKVIYRDLEEFNNVFSKVNQKVASLKNNTAQHPNIKYDINNLIGSSPQMLDLKETIYKIAPRNSTVLIRGQSGTGKELFANAIHTTSYRRNNPFIKVNCAAIPEHLLESELFGYADGAFTGAKKGGFKGKFALANKGTIFLDEIGDMSLSMQAKLLRVLQEKEIVPLGSSETISIDVRIIAATNVNLEEMIKYGKFREDLYYRLNVVTLNVPTLRERKEDIDLLVEHLIKKFNRSFDLSVKEVTAEVTSLFHRYNWPGNVRELENVLEQAFNFVDGETISIEHIPRYLLTYIIKEEKIAVSVPPPADDQPESIQVNKSGSSGGDAAIFDNASLAQMVNSAEKDLIMNALKECKGNKAKAAQLLGISRLGLYKKLAKYNIQ